MKYASQGQGKIFNVFFIYFFFLYNIVQYV